MPTVRIFVSYAHVDEFIVGQVVHILRNAAGYEVWFDEQLTIGKDWKEELEANIQSCDAVLFAMSPDSVVSEYCQWELGKAIDYSKPIIPVLLRANTNVPSIMANLQYVNFTKGPTGEAVAKLVKGISEIAYTIPKTVDFKPPINPKDIPAQAVEAQISTQIVTKPKRVDFRTRIFNWIGGSNKNDNVIGVTRWRKPICPKCMAPLNIKLHAEIYCPKCSYSPPSLYVYQFEKANPFFIQVFGWTMHGKTVYLDVMWLVLSEMTTLWDRFTFQPMDELSMEYDARIRSERRYGLLANATQKKELSTNECYMLRLEYMPRWESRSLIIMDHAGEWFSQFRVPIEDMPYLINFPIAFMFINLSRLEEKGPLNDCSIDRLINGFIYNIMNNGIDLQAQHRKLVVVFTCGDRIEDIIPEEVKEYLRNDNTWHLAHSKDSRPFTEKDMDKYIQKMQEISDLIENWMLHDRKNVPGGANFVNLTRRYNIEARYSVVSAFGRDPVTEDKDRFEIAPMRVLDPLFWGFELETMD